MSTLPRSKALANMDASTWINSPFVLKYNPQTMDAIVDAAELPMSIVVVGIGDADFTNMEILDADEHPMFVCASHL